MKKHNCKTVSNCKITYSEDRSEAELDLDNEMICLDINFCPYCGERLTGDIICIKDEDIPFVKGHRYVVFDQDQHYVEVELSDDEIFSFTYKEMKEYFKNVDN